MVEFEFAVCPRSPIAASLKGYTAPTPRGAVKAYVAEKPADAPPTWYEYAAPASSAGSVALWMKPDVYWKGKEGRALGIVGC